ncbi:phenylalanine--tRNA ligase subunit beta [Arachidicoccus soli]|uniref:Phenylalanine--tRNA ligase beta subunit n=1 Tax=Arachidicoccus soli TaxID=2341117 RepID=A0A386HUL3_9BACT|nr:phenylalanine--tRNA ligase subunit beta [Arachidicoccus soli]AYD49180.1 phenylalanine--tRNA ligase subunit beta [Arachidicoccus soli]
MTISYNWLSEYLPEKTDPEKLSRILTSIGLEVESLEKYQSVKGGLAGLIIGEVLSCEQHPNADKLKLTTVNIGNEVPLKIVCGAPNVAVGQKVVVATVGTTIFPSSGDPLTMKVAKIRGEESFGMLCAEDELGLGQSHAGIMVLPKEVKVGMAASEYFSVYEDYTYEIGLTPNRMDAMSHIGVARDVCAYLTRHNNGNFKYKTPSVNSFKPDNNSLPITVSVENTEAAPRYTGISISNITVASSPDWLQNKLKSIGLRPINNIVDITNFVLHETGQPLHAFDAAMVSGNSIVVKNLPENTPFITLDNKEIKLSADDLMICNKEEGMCIAGVYGGLKSGVSENTKSIFLESAYFHPSTIRKTSMRHGLRTDAAARFEKGVDISNTLYALKRAALLIKEIAGGQISSDIVDLYPSPKERTQVALKFHYLKKLSGKNYHHDAIINVLEALGFEKIKESLDEVWVAVPLSKPDISLPADIVEEILRIDGLDNIDIPSSIHITPAIDTLGLKEDTREKIAGFLVGQGFNEIMTNSITNSKYYSEEILATSVKMINSLSADLDLMRPSMLETGLECLAYNLNRKNSNLQLFEFGKTYRSTSIGKYFETEHLALYIAGKTHEDEWKEKGKQFDFFRAKGLAQSILTLCGLSNIKYTTLENESGVAFSVNKTSLGKVIEVNKKAKELFDIKSSIYFVDIDFQAIIKLKEKETILYKEVARFPSVQRDLAMVVDKAVLFENIYAVIKKSNLTLLKETRLFDIFESEKLGENKKSLAINFTFLDEQKTLTDKEIDAMINKLILGFEKELNAEIRK